MWLQKTFLWKTWTLYGCGPKVRPSAPFERIIANCYQHCHHTIKTGGTAWHLDHLEHFYHIGKEEKSLSPDFLSQVVLSSSWSLYLASTSPMHLVLNFLLNIHVALQDLQDIKDNWLSFRNIKWLSLFRLYLRRPLPNVSSLSLLMYSPSFAKNQWWSVFHISFVKVKMKCQCMAAFKSSYLCICFKQWTASPTCQMPLWSKLQWLVPHLLPIIFFFSLFHVKRVYVWQEHLFKNIHCFHDKKITSGSVWAA